MTAGKNKKKSKKSQPPKALKAPKAKKKIQKSEAFMPEAAQALPVKSLVGDSSPVGSAKTQKKLLDAILLRSLLALGAILLVFILWQVFWKAVTPITLLTSLPKQTLWAMEQYIFSPLPIVNDAKKLLPATNNQPQYLLPLPEAIKTRITALAPKRLLQSQGEDVNGRQFINLIVETSKSDYKGRNDEVFLLADNGINWHIKQIRAGVYQFTTAQEVLMPLPLEQTLAAGPDYPEIFSNLPDQYYAAGLLNFAKVKTNRPISDLPILNDFRQKTISGIGPTGFVLRPDNNKLSFITYTLPANKTIGFPYNDQKYTANLFAVLPENPVMLFGGLETAKRYLQLYQNGRSDSEPLAKQFDKVFAGLNLPSTGFTFLTNMFNQEMAYAKYYLPSGEPVNLLIFSNFETEKVPLLKEILLKIHNYNNPVAVPLALRDGSSGQKLVAGNNEALPVLQFGQSEFSYFTWDNRGTKLPVYWALTANEQTLIFADNPDFLNKLVTAEIEQTTLKNSDIYFQRLLPSLRASDELTYYNRAALQALRTQLTDSDTYSLFTGLLERIDSVSISKNFFPDGLQTFSEFTFSSQPQ